MDKTIEVNYGNPRAGTPAGGFNVYSHSVYGSGSVLAGLPMRSWIGHYDTVEAAQAAHPTARAIDGTTYNEPYISQDPPSWFDPAYAGEAWSEDDY